VLLAAPNVVFELRPVTSGQAAAPQPPSSSFSSLLDPRLARPELLTDVLHQPVSADDLDKWAKSTVREGSEEWEDLLDQLAADQVRHS
jgi:hypothetical protein